MMQSRRIIIVLIVIVTLIQHISALGTIKAVTSPTSNPAIRSLFPELSSPIYWPWPGAPLIVPLVNTLSTADIPNSSADPYYETTQYIIFEISSNQTQQYSSIARFRDAGNDMKYAIVHFMDDTAGAQQLYESLSSSYNRMWINGGRLYQLSGVNSRKYHMLQTCSDVVYRDCYLPTGPIDPKTIHLSHYYMTSRSYDGTFHMTIYNTWNEAMTAYTACQEVSISTLNSTNSTPFWDTVAIYSGGQLIQKISHSRGSELEHMGVFQWLEDTTPLSNDPSSYYLIISNYALNGHSLNRIHKFNTSDDAYKVMNWNTWYNSIAYPLHPSSSYLYYFNTKTRHGTYITSSTKEMNSFNDQMFKLKYEWLTRVSSTATLPPNDPDIYPNSPEPTSEPYNPYPAPAPDAIESYGWSAASNSTQVFVVVLPIVVFTIAGVILLVTYAWMACRHSPTTEIQPSRSVSSLASWILICSIVSFCILMISIVTGRFSYMLLEQHEIIWAEFGPFSMTQGEPYAAWANIHWTAKVFTKTVGISMILAMICLLITIWCIKKHLTHAFTAIIVLASFLLTTAGLIMWIPIHVQIRENPLISPIMLHLQVLGHDCRRVRCVTPYMGNSFILLIIACIIQLLSVMCITIIRCSSRPSHVLLKHSLECVDVAEQYYREVSSPEPVPTPAYVYGGAPPAQSHAPPAYAPSVPASVAPMSIPFERTPPLSVVPAAAAPVLAPPTPVSPQYPKMTSAEGQTLETAPIVHLG